MSAQNLRSPGGNLRQDEPEIFVKLRKRESNDKIRLADRHSYHGQATMRPYYPSSFNPDHRFSHLPRPKSIEHSVDAASGAATASNNLARRSLPQRPINYCSSFTIDTVHEEMTSNGNCSSETPGSASNLSSPVAMRRIPSDSSALLQGMYQQMPQAPYRHGNLYLHALPVPGHVLVDPMTGQQYLVPAAQLMQGAHPYLPQAEHPQLYIPSMLPQVTVPTSQPYEYMQQTHLPYTPSTSAQPAPNDPPPTFQQTYPHPIPFSRPMEATSSPTSTSAASPPVRQEQMMYRYPYGMPNMATPHSRPNITSFATQYMQQRDSPPTSNSSEMRTSPGQPEDPANGREMRRESDFANQSSRSNQSLTDLDETPKSNHRRRLPHQNSQEGKIFTQTPLYGGPPQWWGRNEDTQSLTDVECRSPARNTPPDMSASSDTEVIRRQIQLPPSVRMEIKFDGKEEKPTEAEKKIEKTPRPPPVRMDINISAMEEEKLEQEEKAKAAKAAESFTVAFGQDESLSLQEAAAKKFQMRRGPPRRGGRETTPTRAESSTTTSSRSSAAFERPKAMPSPQVSRGRTSGDWQESFGRMRVSDSNNKVMDQKKSTSCRGPPIRTALNNPLMTRQTSCSKPAAKQEQLSPLPSAERDYMLKRLLGEKEFEEVESSREQGSVRRNAAISEAGTFVVQKAPETCTRTGNKVVDDDDDILTDSSCSTPRELSPERPAPQQAPISPKSPGIKADKPPNGFVPIRPLNYKPPPTTMNTITLGPRPIPIPKTSSSRVVPRPITTSTTSRSSAATDNSRAFQPTSTLSRNGPGRFSARSSTGGGMAGMTSAPLRNSSRPQPPFRTGGNTLSEQQREQERDAYLRRKNYNPARAAAEGRRSTNTRMEQFSQNRSRSFHVGSGAPPVRPAERLTRNRSQEDLNHDQVTINELQYAIDMLVDKCKSNINSIRERTAGCLSISMEDLLASASEPLMEGETLRDQLSRLNHAFEALTRFSETSIVDGRSSPIPEICEDNGMTNSTGEQNLSQEETIPTSPTSSPQPKETASSSYRSRMLAR